MQLDRRIFLGGALAASAAPALGLALDSPFTDAPRRAAIAAIADYLEEHRRHFGLPELAIVVTDGKQSATIASGFRDYTQRQPLRPDDLWQIGSISKSFVALICLQLVQEGKLDLDADIRKAMPETPLPPGLFTVRAMLDHTTGLPDGAPAFPTDGSKLWRGFEPGAHWSYSNTAYELIGRMIERIDRRPLAASIEARIMVPLGMRDSRGAIDLRDRARYPASYEPVRLDQPPRRQTPLAPAPFGVVTFGAGCVAATLGDMARYLDYLAAVGRGHGGPLLSDASARNWLAAPVPEGVPDQLYTMGLMLRKDEGRTLLHHTGGMICFSSSFHVDPDAGVGAYASTALNSLVGYRPRLLTRFAVAAMRHAAAGTPLPAPPPLATPIARPGDYAGRYADDDRRFTIEAGAGIGAGLALIDGRDRLPLEEVAPGMFLAGGRFASFPLIAARDGEQIVGLDWGRRRFGKDGRPATLPGNTPRLLAREGRYQSDDPWVGGTTIVARGGRLYADGVQLLTEIGDDVWRAADEEWSPERLRFGGYVDGRPMWASFSGRVMERRDS